MARTSPSATSSSIAWLQHGCGTGINYEEKKVWRGAGHSCSQVLHDPLQGTFEGIFADESRPVAIWIMSDSIGHQLKKALEQMAKANPSLSNLTILDDPYWVHQTPIFPRSVGG